MPATSEKQAVFMRLAGYYKKHGRMPHGAGRASAELKAAASSMTMDQLQDFMHTKKPRRGTVLTGGHE